MFKSVVEIFPVPTPDSFIQVEVGPADIPGRSRNGLVKNIRSGPIKDIVMVPDFIYISESA
jgi:hypothetical protein